MVRMSANSLSMALLIDGHSGDSDNLRMTEEKVSDTILFGTKLAQSI